MRNHRGLVAERAMALDRLPGMATPPIERRIRERLRTPVYRSVFAGERIGKVSHELAVKVKHRLVLFNPIFSW